MEGRTAPGSHRSKPQIGGKKKQLQQTPARAGSTHPRTIRKDQGSVGQLTRNKTLNTKGGKILIERDSRKKGSGRGDRRQGEGIETASMQRVLKRYRGKG